MIHAGWQYTPLTYSFSNFDPSTISNAVPTVLLSLHTSFSGSLVKVFLIFLSLPVCCDPWSGYSIVNKAGQIFNSLLFTVKITIIWSQFIPRSYCTHLGSSAFTPLFGPSLNDFEHYFVAYEMGACEMWCGSCHDHNLIWLVSVYERSCGPGHLTLVVSWVKFCPLQEMWSSIPPSKEDHLKEEIATWSSILT